MNTTTLRGVFPEPNISEPVYKRNFIKENVKHIKRMQGLIQNSGVLENKEDRFRNKPLKTTSHTSNGLNKSSKSVTNSQSVPGTKTFKVPIKRKSEPDKSKGDARNCQLKIADKHTHRGVQTERAEDIKKLYDTGIIRYPSPSVIKTIDIKTTLRKTKPEIGKDKNDMADNTNSENLNKSLQNIDLNAEHHDYIKENIKAIKLRSARLESPQETMKKTNPRGILPKYLKERKVEVDEDCPDGHVLLPEEERKETLKVLRQSYADRIQELNAMPVRNDTLRMRNRKIAIEEELKKIDEGIKVFQRPKVYVKINA